MTTYTSPPSVGMRRKIARPMPEPGTSRPCRRLKGLKMSWQWRGGTPMPLSITANSSAPSTTRAVTWMRGGIPGRWYLRALPSRFCSSSSSAVWCTRTVGRFSFVITAAVSSRACFRFASALSSTSAVSTGASSTLLRSTLQYLFRAVRSSPSCSEPFTIHPRYSRPRSSSAAPCVADRSWA